MNKLQVQLDIDGIERLCDRATSGNVSHIVGTIKSYCRMIKEELDVPDWSHYRAQAAIAAMQGFLSRHTYKADLTTLAKDSVKLANCLIEELKEEK